MGKGGSPMPQTRSPHVPLVLAVLILAGCSTPKEVFMHRWHRENFAVTDQELKTAQFYISAEVLAKRVSDGGPATAESVVIVPAETPGVVTDAGPDWVWVSFQTGGSGVPFAAILTGKSDSAYWLATEVEGEPGFRPVREVTDRILRVGGEAYQLLSGYNARLLISSKDMERLIGERTHIPGRQKESE
jgi:hypothetical protein